MCYVTVLFLKIIVGVAAALPFLLFRSLLLYYCYYCLNGLLFLVVIDVVTDEVIGGS